jgi:hypothetical protein
MTFPAHLLPCLPHRHNRVLVAPWWHVETEHQITRVDGISLTYTGDDSICPAIDDEILLDSITDDLWAFGDSQ